jgi:hypothetical protein
MINKYGMTIHWYVKDVMIITVVNVIIKQIHAINVVMDIHKILILKYVMHVI